MRALAIIKGFSTRKKVLLFGGLIFILLLGLGAFFFRSWSHQEFDKFVQKLENFSQQEMDIILATDQFSRDLKGELSAIVSNETADPTENKSHLAKAEAAYAEMYAKQKDEYLPLFEEKIAEIGQFLNRRRYLWLWGDETEFLDLIVSVSEAAVRAKEADAITLERVQLLYPVAFEIQADTIDYLGFVKTYGGARPSSAMMGALAPFEKYTTDYKFAGEEQLKTLYPSFYEALTNFKTLYAKVYEMYAAYTSGNYTKTIQLSNEIVSISKLSFDLTTDWEPLNRPFFQGELDAHVNGLLAANLYKESKLGNVSLGSRRLAAFALMWATQLYALDHNDEYPEAGSVVGAVHMLTAGNYLPSNFQFDQTTFSSTMDKERYQVSFTDEVTGEVVSLTSVD